MQLSQRGVGLANDQIRCRTNRRGLLCLARHQTPLTHQQRNKRGMQDASVDRHRSYLLASERLQTLLEEAKLSNKDVVLVDHISSMSPEERLTLFTNLGTLALLAQVLGCLIFGEADPLGGMDFTAASLHAAAVGAGYAMPLLLCSVAARTDLFRGNFPVLDQLHTQQADLQRRFTAGMNVTQVAIWLSFVIVPSMLVLLPATQATVVWSATFAQQMLLQTWASGLHFPHIPLGGLALLAAPLLSSYLAGTAAGTCFGVRPKQVEMLRDAWKNADAYFRLAAARQPGVGPGGAAGRLPAAAVPQVGPPSVFASSSSLTLDLDGEMSDDAGWGDEEDEGDEPYNGGQVAADAFKTLAMVWLVSRRHVAQLACVLTGMNVMYYSILWWFTGDMSTPIMAAFLHAAAEVWYGEQGQPRHGSSKAGGR